MDEHRVGTGTGAGTETRAVADTGTGTKMGMGMEAGTKAGLGRVEERRRVARKCT